MSWIIREIEGRGGEVSFSTFMELALYHPEHGYYSSAEPRYGRSGDFLTAPSASPWYARVVARLLGRLAPTVGHLALVDVGSGDGSFVSGVIDALGDDAGGVVGALVIVERSASMARVQRNHLQEMGIPWQLLDDISLVDTAGMPVVFHACELYDALPVDRVVMGHGGLSELKVVASDTGLEWCRRPAGPEVAAYFEEQGVELQPGQTAELSLDWRRVHRKLLTRATGDGLALILDYGYPAARLYNSRGRSGGSLCCYRDHRLSRDPLTDPGELDITAHVNWDDLRFAAGEAGWTEVGSWALAEFLVRAGIGDVMESFGVGETAELTADTVTERQEIKRLLDPDGMGVDLKMLVQAKGSLLDTVSGELKSRTP